MITIKLSPFYAASQLRQMQIVSLVLFKLLASTNLTHSEKRAISRTLDMVITETLSELITDDSDGEIPF